MRALRNQEDHCTFTLNLICFMSTCYHVFSMFLCLLISMVVGSGSEGAPKYVGEGVTYGVFLGINHIFSHVCTI